ncbi:MAG: alpha/beta hydrolase [Ignavibacteriae bacterium]|nr:alpha/beta hydrolase [Ignavibacteriota bacterium]
MNEITLRTVQFDSPSGKPIVADIRSIAGGSKKPIVLVLHGFKGFKDWGFFPFVSTELVKRGAISISINFSLNGYVVGSDKVENPEDFARNTISLEIEEVILTVSKILDSSFSEFSNRDGNVFLLGHSRGGGVALISAAKDRKRIQKTVVWNSIGTFERFTERQKKIWRETGTFQVENSRTHQTLGMNIDFLNDIESHSDEFSLLAAAKELDSSLLIIHGEQDMTVPVREAKKLAEQAGNIQLQIIPSTGHTFGITHPFEQTSAALNIALDYTCTFFGL